VDPMTIAALGVLVQAIGQAAAIVIHAWRPQPPHVVVAPAAQVGTMGTAGGKPSA